MQRETDVRGALGTVWCRLVHRDVTWPVHGYYQCKDCRRIYRVPWEEPAPFHRPLAAAKVRETRELVRPRTLAA